jgi:hypothetical protein
MTVWRGFAMVSGLTEKGCGGVPMEISGMEVIGTVFHLVYSPLAPLETLPRYNE